MTDKQPAIIGNAFGSLGSGFANLSAKAKEISTTVASQVSDMNAKVLAAADSRAAAAATGTTTTEKPAGGGNTVATASREELVDVLQKLNKKVKALNTLRTQLTEKAEAAEQDRDKLIDIFQKEVLQGMDLSSLDTTQSQADQLLALWTKKDKLQRDQLDELKSQIQTLQSGNGGYVESGDTKALREQMQQDHDRVVAALKAEHAKEVAQLKQLSTTPASSMPVGDVNASEIETLKKSHEEAMENLKKAATLQMQTFKKKVAAARTAELEKVVKETREKVTEELKGSMNNAEDANRVREELEKKHLEALEQMKAELTAQSAKDIEARVNKLLTTMNNQAKEHEEELQRERQLFKQQLEEAQLKIKSLQDAVVESASQFDSVQSQLEALKSTSLTEKAELLASHKQEVEKRIAEVRAELQKAHGDQLKAMKTASESGQSDAVKELRERFAVQAKSFQQKAIAEKNLAVEKATKDAQASMQGILENKDAEHQAQLEAQRNGHKTAISQLQEEMTRAIANAEASSAKLAATEERLKQIEADRANEVRELNERVLFSQASGEASNREIQIANDQMQSQLASLQRDKEAHEQTIAAMKAEHEKAMAELEKSMQVSSTASSATEARISELEKIASEKDAELSSSKMKFEEDLAAVKGQLSNLEIAKQELEKKLAGAGSSEVELQKKCDEMIVSIEALKTTHAAEIANLKEQVEKDATSDVDAEIKEAIERENKKHADEIQHLKSKMADHVDKMNAQFLEKLNAEKEKIKLEKEELEEKGKKREEHLSNLEQVKQELETKLKVAGETSAREIQIANDQMQSQLASSQRDKEAHEQTIAALKAEHEKAMAELEKSMQVSSTASSATEARISELEKIASEKDAELNSSKVKFEEDLAAIKGQLSNLEIAKQELEKKLAGAGSSEVELQKKCDEMVASIEALKTTHAAEIANLKEQVEKDATSDVDAKIKEAVERETKKHADEIQHLKSKMADHVDKMNAQFLEKLNGEREKIKLEKEELEEKGKKREEQVAKLAKQLKDIGEAATKEREEKMNLQKAIKAEISKRQKIEEEIVIQKRQLEDFKQASAAAAAKEQEALKEANLRLEAEMKSLREHRNSSANKVEELTGKLEALTNNLNSMAEDINKKDEALATAQKHKARLDSSENEVAELRQQITKMKLELTKNTQLANRLQSEKEASERNHGQRTALMGMLEGQLAEINEKNSEMNAKLEAALYDLSQKDELVQSLEDRLKETQTALITAEQKNKETAEILAQTQKGTAKKNSAVAESLQKELQLLQQSTARKSAAAQKLIQEREAECAALRAANKKLQQEVDKGSLSDRKIFELAELQSNRESAQQIEIEVRDNAIERLKQALLDRDWDLASAENTVQEVEAQVEELGRVKRREDVNMDYLKSIVVQYLSKPPGTSERAALLPVLATLLQFDADDYKLIEDGKKSLTWFGSVEPKVIGVGVTSSSTDIFSSALADFSSYLGKTTTATSNDAIATVASPAPARVAASAEISVSTPVVRPASGSGRTTSLQF